jgi:rhodanese-related sulfurtransferase
MKRTMLALVAAMLCAGPALGYDQDLAAVYEDFFASFDEQAVPKALHLMPAEKVVDAIKKGDGIVLLDVRTKQEQSILGLTFPETLHLPMNQVFKPENLAKIPTDKKVIVTCQSGVRCAVIAISLRNIGFDNVYTMKGGLMGLMQYLSPKTAF